MHHSFRLSFPVPKIIPYRPTTMNKIISLFFIISILLSNSTPVSAEFKKTRVAVLDFQLQGEGFETSDMGKIVAEWLITAFVKNGRFEVIERNLLKKIIDEQKLIMTGVVDENSATKIGKLLGVKVIISGSLMKFQNIMEVNARIIDVENASIIAAEGVKSNSAVRLEDLVIRMADKIIKDFPLEGYIVNRDKNKIIIDLGKRSGIKRGMRFIAYKEGAVIKHPKTGEVLDVKKIKTGLIEITSIRKKMANGIIIKESSPGLIEYGQMVMSTVKIASADKSKLFVNTDPDDTEIRILNIGPPYRRGMELKAGKYHLEISAAGYIKKKKWVELNAGENKELYLALEKYTSAPVAVEPSRTQKPQEEMGIYDFSSFGGRASFPRIDALLQEAIRLKKAGNYQWRTKTKKITVMLKKMLRQDKRSPVVYYYYGKVNMVEGFFSKAAKYLARAVKFDRQYHQAYALQGDAYYYWGKQGRSTKKLGKRALKSYKLAANSSKSIKSKAMIYLKMGNVYAELFKKTKNAKQYWQKAIETAPGSRAAALAGKKL